MKHYIIVKFIDGYDFKSELDNISKLFNKSKDVDGVSDINIYLSNSNRDNRHDLMIEMELTNNGLINFDNSQIHKEWKDLYGKNILNKVIFDCD